MLTVSSAGTISYRRRKINIGQAWKGQMVTAIETGPDRIVVLEHTAGTALRELIRHRQGKIDPWVVVVGVRTGDIPDTVLSGHR
jgi:hypothetical protein